MLFSYIFLLFSHLFIIIILLLGCVRGTWGNGFCAVISSLSYVLLSIYLFCYLFIHAFVCVNLLFDFGFFFCRFFFISCSAALNQLQSSRGNFLRLSRSLAHLPM